MIKIFLILITATILFAGCHSHHSSVGVYIPVVKTKYVHHKVKIKPYKYHKGRHYGRGYHNYRYHNRGYYNYGHKRHYKNRYHRYHYYGR